MLLHIKIGQLCCHPYPLFLRYVQQLRQGHVTPAYCSDGAFRHWCDLVSWLGKDHDVYYGVIE